MFWLRRGPGINRPFMNAVILLALSAITLQVAAGQQALAPATDQSPRISVDVDLVVLHATVSDSHDHLVTDLQEQNFEVYEDGIRQQISLFRHEDVPVAVGLVVDHSASMRRKLPDVSAAARTFVHSSNPQDQMFVINFNENVSLGLPGTVRFSNSGTELERAILNAPAGGKTALYDAVVEALGRVKQSPLNKKVLIVISDGGDNASAHTLAQVTNLAEQSSAIIYTMGIFDEEDADRNPRVLRRLARATGGKAFFPGRTSEVVDICERIAHDIRHQYTIGYAPTNPTRNGGYRSVRVAAQASGHGKLMVRTRTGYLAQAP